MPAVSAMASVHEHVQQGAGEKDQERQISEDVSPVLGKQQRASDSQESEEDEAAARGPEAACRGRLMMRVLVVCHIPLPFPR